MHGSDVWKLTKRSLQTHLGCRDEFYVFSFKIFFTLRDSKRYDDIRKQLNVFSVSKI